MFIHNFKYTLKSLVKDKALIFWTFAFPIILGTFFNMAFSNIVSSEKLKIIDIAIVDDEEFRENQIFQETFKTLSDENNEDRLFETRYVSLSEANSLLEKEEIVGYLKLSDDKTKVVVSTNGINQTIFKYVVEEIVQKYDMISNLSKQEIEKEINSGNFDIDYQGIYKKVEGMVNNNTINILNTTNNNLDYSMVEFYTLIAMTCLYGGILGMVAINKSLANMSSKGKRVSIAPTKKGIVIISSLLSGFVTQLVGLALLLIYTIFVLKIDYGTNIPLIVILSVVGSLAGLSLGLFVGSVIKASENTKVGILISITMFCCFLSGMMGITMKYVIDKNIPIVNKLNPANMITDGFYSLYYYDTQERFWFNIISLLLTSLILITISIFSLRRQKYDSI